MKLSIKLLGALAVTTAVAAAAAALALAGGTIPADTAGLACASRPQRDLPEQATAHFSATTTTPKEQHK